MAASVIPPNKTPATAIEVTSLPYSTTQDVNFGGTTHIVWYKYTTGEYQYNLSITSLGDEAPVNYSPICDLYDSDGTTYIENLTNNGVCQTEIEQEKTYYFKFTSSTGNKPDPCILTFGITEGPNEAMPAGTVILINDDTPGFPGAFINNTGKVVGFRNGIVPGEEGDVLKDGSLILHDGYSDDDSVVIYNSDMTVRIRIPLESVAPGSVSVLGSDHNNIFYVGFNGVNTIDPAPVIPARITAISKTGTIINTWIVPLVDPLDKFIINITGSTDGRYVYFQNSYPNSNIKRLDTTDGTFSTFSSTIPTGATTARYRTMFVIEGTGARSGEDVLVHMWNMSSGYEIIEYDSLGVPTVVRSYVTVTDGDGNRLLRAYTSDNIMLWTDAPDSEMVNEDGCYEYKMRWRKVSINTGDAVEDFMSVVYEGGSSEVADGCVPTDEFGHSMSCPAIVPPVNIPALPKAPEVNYSGIYQVKRGKTDDTVYTAVSPQTTEDVKIPDPFVKTSLLGG